MTHLQVSEIFHSIQGESTRAGAPCIFVRLTGCNLRCRWCDTEYAFYGGRRMAVAEVMAAVATYPCRRVEITGGEPLLQGPAAVELAEELLRQGYEVMIETSGERDLGALPAAVTKIVDVKCPASGEAGSFRLENLKLLRPWDELKFVLADRADYEFALEFIAAHGLSGISPTLLFSPAFRKDAAGERGSAQCQLDPRTLAEWMLRDGAPARLSLQIHKFIWDPALHGV
ncbi:MAG TPA: radical SAM protein [Terriglobales bacterium]|nr:radical SAM protein [Terriglobales bacterium]